MMAPYLSLKDLCSSQEQKRNYHFNAKKTHPNLKILEILLKKQLGVLMQRLVRKLYGTKYVT